MAHIVWGKQALGTAMRFCKNSEKRIGNEWPGQQSWCGCFLQGLPDAQPAPPLCLVLAGPSHQGHQGWQVPAHALGNEALEFKPAGASEGVYGKSKGGNRRAGTETQVATLTGHPTGHSTSPNRIYPLTCHPTGHNPSPVILSGSLVMLRLFWGCFVFSLRKKQV